MMRRKATKIDLLICNGTRYGITTDGHGSLVTIGFRKTKGVRDQRFKIMLHNRAFDDFSEYDFISKNVVECYTPDVPQPLAVIVNLNIDVYKHSAWQTLTRDPDPEPVQLRMIVDEISDQWSLLLTRLFEECKCMRLSAQEFDDKLKPGDDMVLHLPPGLPTGSLLRFSLNRLAVESMWLNDELINVGLRFLLEDQSTVEKDFNKRVMCLSAGSWKALDLGIGKRVLRDSFRKFVAPDPMSFYHHMIPINMSGSHWMLAIVCYPFNVIRMAHKEHTQNQKQGVEDKCTIMILDSISQAPVHYRRQFRIIREFLQVCAQDKTHTPVKVLKHEIPEGWIEERVLEVPQQKDSIACGLYVLHFASEFLRLGDRLLTEDSAMLMSAPQPTKMRRELLIRTREASEAYLDSLKH